MLHFAFPKLQTFNSIDRSIDAHKLKEKPNKKRSTADQVYRIPWGYDTPSGRDIFWSRHTALHALVCRNKHRHIPQVLQHFAAFTTKADCKPASSGQTTTPTSLYGVSGSL